MRAVAAGAGLLVVLAIPLRSDEPIGSSVTFNREIIRIFERKCLQCHAPGAVAMPLANYRDARLWARSIREELLEQRMPPWRAAPGYGSFSNDIGLTPRERTTLLTWADGGAPRGQDQDLPQRSSGPQPAAVAADHTLPLPAQQIPAGATLVRRVTVDVPGAGRRAVRQIRIVPGDLGVLRAAFVTASSRTTSGDQWVGVWTPWLRGLAPPNDGVFRFPNDVRLTIELHYVGVDRGSEDRSHLQVFFADGSTRAAGEFVIAPAAARGGQWYGEVRVRQPTRLWALLPDPTATRDADGGSLEVSAHQPDGAVEVLLWIPTRQHEWPTPYIFSELVVLTPGTVVKVRSSAAARVRFSTVDSAITSGP